MNPYIKDYGGEIDWSIGSLFCHEKPVFRLLRICEAYSIEHPIRYAFGSIPSLMAGGRIPPTSISVNEAIDVAKQYLNNGIACRLTLSNPYVDRHMIQSDAINAELMKYLDSNRPDGKRNGIIVVSDILAEYVKETYPNLEVILSIIRPAYDTGYGKDKDTMDWYADKLQNPLYDVVVVNAAKLYEKGFMESLPYKDKVELLACHDCIRNCPYAKTHYEAVLMFSQCLVNGISPDRANLLLGDIIKTCVKNKKSHMDQTASYSIDEIRYLASLGYRQFKLAGRMNTEERFSRDLEAYLFNHEVLRYIETAMQ